MQFNSVDPATGERHASFGTVTHAAIESMLERAGNMAPTWRQAKLEERIACVTRLGYLLRERQDALAGLMTREMGKLDHEGLAEIEKCAVACEFFAENAPGWLADEQVITDAGRSLIAWQPLGAVLAVMPWNFPFWQVIRCAVPALLGGNVMVLKHAPNVPQCALAIESLFRDAGFPEGVLQNVFAETSQIAHIIADPRINAVTLTGSERAGRAVAEVAGRSLKKCVLELGGSDPFVVFEDAPLKAAIKTAVISRFQNAGQSCIAAKRFIVVEAVHDVFIAGLKQAVSALRMGDTLAPMARTDLRDAVHQQVRGSIAKGAICLVGGDLPEGPGAYYPATLLVDVRPGMPAADEEIFGPVASVMRATDEADARRLANASRYGLGASVWTEDLGRGERFARSLDCGMAFVNGMVRSDPRLPFGGIKASGYGRELSQLGLREFMNAKTVWLR